MARGHRSQPVDAGRPGRRLRLCPAAASRSDRGACAGRRAPARRRHHRADPGQGQDRSPAGPGSMSAMTRRSAGRRRRRRCYYASRDRSGEHPERHLQGFAGILQADAYSGLQRLYRARPQAGPVTRGAVLEPCPAQVLRAGRYRRQCPARQAGAADLAAGARGGQSASMRCSTSSGRSTACRPRSASPFAAPAPAPLVADLEAWMRSERARLSRHAPVAKAIDYMLKRWDGFTRFLDDGRICLTASKCCAGHSADVSRAATIAVSSAVCFIAAALK
jgi:hypothetical protein